MTTAVKYIYLTIIAHALLPNFCIISLFFETQSENEVLETFNESEKLRLKIFFLRDDL